MWAMGLLEANAAVDGGGSRGEARDRGGGVELGKDGHDAGGLILDEDPLTRDIAGGGAVGVGFDECPFKHPGGERDGFTDGGGAGGDRERKSTRLNSSHQLISYAVFCLKKKKKE